MWIGCLKHCKDKIENINWVTDYVKCLGIYFGHNKAECKKLNIEKQLLKFLNSFYSLFLVLHFLAYHYI
jgi:hypothetical protein